MFRTASSVSTTRRLARVASDRLAGLAAGAPSSAAHARHKATRAAPVPHAVHHESQSPRHHLPWHVSVLGDYLGASLSRAQLDAFADAFLPRRPPTGDVVAASDAAAALAALRRERDDATRRVAALERDALESRLRLQHVDRAAFDALREDLRDAKAAAADARVALNALREQTKTIEETREQDLADATEAAIEETRRRAALEFEALRESSASAAEAARTFAERAALHREAAETRERAAKDALALAERRADRAEARARGLERESANAATAAASEKAATHETFGTLLRDFGHKRVYAMPAGNLASKEKVRVYDQQRAFRAERSEVIAAEKAKEAVFSLPGVISVAEGTAKTRPDARRAPSARANLRRRSKDSGEDSGEVSLSILDGQHRVGAIEILLKRGVLSPSDEILVEVFPDVDDRRARHLFSEINAAQPIRLVDAPGSASPDLKWMLEGACARAKQKYPAMFSASHRPKLPRLNVDALRQELFDAEVATRANLADEESFFAWLEERNARLKARAREDWLAARPKRGRGARLTDAAYLRALDLAEEHGFFLGMDFAWLDDIEE